MSVDTLSLARELRAAEIAPSQAEAIAAAIGRAVESVPSALDLSRLEAKFDALGERIDAVLVAVNSQSESVRVELKAEMRATVETVSARIESARSSLLTWIVSVIVAGIGVAVALVKH